MATTSLGSSTTQMTSSTRRGSRQIRHCSPSATLKQVVQKRTSSCTRCSAATSRLTSADSAASRWKAMRCALFGPTPGSRPSSSMRSWTAPSYTVSLSSGGPPRPLQAGQPQAAAEAAGERPHAAGGEFVDGAGGVAEGRDDQVLQALDVVRVDGGGCDRHRGDLALAGHGDADPAAAGRAGDLLLRQLLLRGSQLLLHLLRLLEQACHVGLTTGEHAPRVGRGCDERRDDEPTTFLNQTVDNTVTAEHPLPQPIG